MKKIKIIADKYLNDNGLSISIGGVETYIHNLCNLLIKMNYYIDVYQYGNISKDCFFDGVNVHIIKQESRKKFVDLVRHASIRVDYKNDLLLFASDLFVVRNNFKNVIAIQHGIAWDIPTTIPKKDLSNYLFIIKGAIRTIVKYIRFKKCTYIVCVDYNFINWYRTQINYIKNNILVIPNFSDYDENGYSREDKECINIIFARRLVEYRGTRIFVEAIKNIIIKYPNINVCIAGNGPEEKFMKKELNCFKNVIFTTYSSQDSIRFHSNYDIAVIPTLGSEGTSLSLLEAMSAGCSVIATYVGGISNILLNYYNGLIIEPNSKSLTEALEILINDKELRTRLSKNAVETIRSSFSLDNWEKKWSNVFNEIERNK